MMLDSNRRTGRTTAALKNALAFAKAGRHVIYYCHSTHMAHVARAMLEELAGAPVVMRGTSHAFSGRVEFASLPSNPEKAVHERQRRERGSDVYPMFDHVLAEPTSPMERRALAAEARVAQLEAKLAAVRAAAGGEAQ